MKLILLSGGSGKRLWPLSNDSRSKQFLKVLQHNNRPESMVQRVWRQLTESGLREGSWIVTGKGQVDILQSQLQYNAPVIVEPERRDTFPAIALAASYLYSIEGVSLDEVITVLPVDPYVEDVFFNQIEQLDSVIKDSKSDLALIGVMPTYPSEKYGYIVPKYIASENKDPYIQVSHFVEKPREDKAKELIEQQALWNCGVFAFRLEFLIQLLIRNNLPIHYDEMVKQYHLLPKISFDYQVVERAENIVVTSYEGTWKDLGTWNTLVEEIDRKVIGNGIVAGNSANTHLINELEIPIAVLGVPNIIVAASPDGIIVADKDVSPQIKDVMRHLEQRPMYEERRWGSYRVLDFLKYPNGEEVLTKRICIAKGRNLSYQYHLIRSEVWTVVAGEGEMILDGEHRSLCAGDVVIIPPKSRHSLRAITDLELIEVQTGSELVEEDIVRLATDWEEIVTTVLEILIEN